MVPQRLLALVLVLSVFLENRPLLGGQVAPPPVQEVERGIVLVVGGIGGMDFLGVSALSALPRVGVKHEIREFVWTHGWGQLLKDLQDNQHLRQKAEELADIVRRYKAENPQRPIYLVAKSGGTGLVLASAELLPANTLERIILLSAAVSPTYDLRRALKATRGEIVWHHRSRLWPQRRPAWVSTPHRARGSRPAVVSPAGAGSLELTHALAISSWATRGDQPAYVPVR
jgi:hypothetical protein